MKSDKGMLAKIISRPGLYRSRKDLNCWAARSHYSDLQFSTTDVVLHGLRRARDDGADRIDRAIVGDTDGHGHAERTWDV